MAAVAAKAEAEGAVGGLAEGVAAADLETMWASVGRVAGVEFVRTNGRSFAYVPRQALLHRTWPPLQLPSYLFTSMAISRLRFVASICSY